MTTYVKDTTAAQEDTMSPPRTLIVRVQELPDSFGDEVVFSDGEVASVCGDVATLARAAFQAQLPVRFDTKCGQVVALQVFAQVSAVASSLGLSEAQ